MIQNGSQVKLHYTLTVDDQVVDSSVGRAPLEYVQGESQIIPGLEEQLVGLNAGDKKKVTVAPDKAYGFEDPQAVHAVPRSAFQNPGELHVGDRVSGQVDGRQFQARVTAVGTADITIDLNHPLAGKTLSFAVEILEVA